MKFCEDCFLTQKTSGGYVGCDDTNDSTVEECEAHPRLENWRVIRTLKTVRAWSLEPAGYAVALSMTCRMPVHLGGGHIHERTARAKMFDYEGPMIDFLVEGKYLERHDGHRHEDETMPRTLTVTAKGDELIRSALLEAEAKGKVKNTAHYKRHEKTP